MAALLLAAASCNSGSVDNAAGSSDTTAMDVESLTRRIGEDPENADLYRQRALQYMLEKKFDKALTDIRQSITLKPRDPAHYLTLADIYLLMGQIINSREALTKALGLDPENRDALLKMAKLCHVERDYKGCYSYVAKLLELDRTYAAAYYTRAVALIEQGDTVRAAEDLKQAVDYNQDYYEAYVQLGELYSVKKDPMAELYFRNALNIRPTSREALYNLGLFYQETGKYDKAIQTYQALAKADTSNRDAYHNTGYIYLVYLNDYRKAISFFDDAVKRDPGFYEAWFNKGYAHELLGEYEQAAGDYHTALKIKVNYDKAVEGLNRIDRITLGKQKPGRQ